MGVRRIELDTTLFKHLKWLQSNNIQGNNLLIHQHVTHSSSRGLLDIIQGSTGSFIRTLKTTTTFKVNMGFYKYD